MFNMSAFAFLNSIKKKQFSTCCAIYRIITADSYFFYYLPFAGYISEIWVFVYINSVNYNVINVCLRKRIR